MITVKLNQLDVRSGAVTGDGGNAYGLRAINQANVTVTNSSLTASNGSGGSNGSTPSGTLTAGGVGTNGLTGVNHEVRGGAAPGSGANSGGNGGNGGGNAGINGANGGGGGGGGCNNGRSNYGYSGGGAVRAASPGPTGAVDPTRPADR